MSSTLFGALSSKDKLQQSITSLSKQIGTLTTTTENLSWKKRVCRPTDWADVSDTLFDITIPLLPGEIVEDCFMLLEQPASSNAGDTANIDFYSNSWIPYNDQAVMIIPTVVASSQISVNRKDDTIPFPLALTNVLTADNNNITIRITDSVPISNLDAHFTFFYKTAILP